MDNKTFHKIILQLPQFMSFLDNDETGEIPFEFENVLNGTHITFDFIEVEKTNKIQMEKKQGFFSNLLTENNDNETELVADEDGAVMYETATYEYELCLVEDKIKFCLINIQQALSLGLIDNNKANELKNLF